MTIKKQGIHLLGYLLCTCKYGGVMMQKVCPMMYAIPFWSLICYKTNKGRLIVLSLAQDVAQSFFHGDIVTPKTSTHFQKKTIESCTSQRMVNLCCAPTRQTAP